MSDRDLISKILADMSKMRPCSLLNEQRNMYEKRPLRKHAYSNILKILQTKKENFQI